MFPRIYSDEPCPLDGYDLVINVLANPTFAEKQAWWAATLGDPSCAACAALSDGARCEACTEARRAFGESMRVIFQKIGDLDLSTPETCVRAIEAQIPDELLAWLWQAPSVIWAARNEDVKKKLRSFLTIGDSTPSLDETTPQTNSIET